MALENLCSEDNRSETTKIKTHFAKIIVSGTADKPYYDIMWLDPVERIFHIGYGSYCLEYVFKWLSEEFEIVEPPTIEAQRWIPVTERLPEKGQKVLVLYRGLMETGHYCKVGSLNEYAFIQLLPENMAQIFQDVTHWMPLPEAPKDGDT